MIGLNISFNHYLELGLKEIKNKLEKYLDAIQVFVNNFSFLGVNQFIYQEWKPYATNFFSFTGIYSHICINPMILVNISHQNFDNFNKNSWQEFIHLKNPHKNSQKFKTTRTHYFINQRSYLNISPTNRQKHLLVATFWYFDWLDLSSCWGVQNLH